MSNRITIESFIDDIFGVESETPSYSDFDISSEMYAFGYEVSSLEHLLNIESSMEGLDVKKLLVTIIKKIKEVIQNFIKMVKQRLSVLISKINDVYKYVTAPNFPKLREYVDGLSSEDRNSFFNSTINGRFVFTDTSKIIDEFSTLMLKYSDIVSGLKFEDLMVNNPESYTKISSLTYTNIADGIFKPEIKDSMSEFEVRMRASKISPYKVIFENSTINIKGLDVRKLEKSIDTFSRSIEESIEKFRRFISNVKFDESLYVMRTSTSEELSKEMDECILHYAQMIGRLSSRVLRHGIVEDICSSINSIRVLCKAYESYTNKKISNIEDPKMKYTDNGKEYNV